MKKPVSLLLIALVALPSSALAGLEECRPVCDEYEKAVVLGQFDGRSGNNPMSLAYVQSKCGKPSNGAEFEPGNASLGRADDASRGISPDYASGDAKWNECYAGLKERWSVVGPSCSAMKLDSQSQTWDEISAIAYTVAATACWAAAAAEASVIGAPFMKGVCMGTAIAAAAGDITSTALIRNAGEAASSPWSQATGAAGAGAASVGAVGATAFNTSSTFNTASSLAAAIFLTAAATLKWNNQHQMGKYAERECATIKSLQSKVAETNAGGPDAGGTGSTTPDGAASGGSDTSGVSGSGAGGPYVMTVDQVADTYLKPQYAAAMAGPYGTLFNALPKDQFPRMLQQAAGIGLKDIARELRKGSPADFLAGIQGLPPAVAQSVRQIDKDVKAGKYNLAGASSAPSAYSAAGTRGASAKAAAPNPFGMLGLGAGAAPSGGASEAAFEKMKRAPELLSGGDIWHEGYGGSIFQIVSSKLEKTRDRIEELEWETPLNRALAGLPAKKPAAGARGPAAGRK